MNPTLQTYFLYNLQGQWSAIQVLMFVLSSFREAECLMKFGRGFHK